MTDRQTFAVTLDSIPLTTPMRFVAGKLLFTTGANAGLQRLVKLDPMLNSGVIVFWEEFPEQVTDGDEFTLFAGCDLQADTCKFYGNFNRIRAHGLFIPGVMAITAGPQTPQELGG